MTRPPPSSPPPTSGASIEPMVDVLLGALPDPPLPADLDRETHARARQALAAPPPAANTAWPRRVFDLGVSLGLTGVAAAYMVWAAMSLLSVYR